MTTCSYNAMRNIRQSIRHDLGPPIIRHHPPDSVTCRNSQVKASANLAGSASPATRGTLEGYPWRMLGPERQERVVRHDS